MGFSIIFGNTKYAQAMRYGMADVIDVTGYREAFPDKAKNKSYRESFEELMGFTGVSPLETKCADMKSRTFIVNDTPLEYHDRREGRNYARLEVGNSNIYYVFITGATQQNTNATLYSFEIDWWHTWVCHCEALPKLYQGYVVRDNKHSITSNNDNILIKCGRGREDVALYDMPQLESETACIYAAQNLTTLSDKDIKYIRFTFSTSDVAKELFANGINAQRDELGTGLVYGFLPLIPRGEYAAIRQVMGGTTATLTRSYDNYLAYTNALTRALTLAPTCVSVELIPSAPFVKRIDSFQTTSGGLGLEMTFDETAVVAISPTIEKLKDNIWLLQTGVSSTTILPSSKIYRVEHELQCLNSPVLTCAYRNSDIFSEAYSHTLKRSDMPTEPKLGQPQFSSTLYVDNMGGKLLIDPTELNGELEKIEVIADYTGSTFKRKWYLSDGEKAYLNDIKGRKYCAYSDKMQGYPLVNDAYIDYMNGRRNQIINGLAVQQATGVANAVSGAIESNAAASLAILGGVYGVNGAQVVGAVGKYTSSLTGNVINGIQNALAAKWNFDAQTADLKEAANTVERGAGNNPEFDVIENNGAIVRQVWRPTEKDTRRLVEYFHMNGYAVGEWQSDISLDTMYYFDYIQAQDIDFYVTGNVRNDYNYQSDQPAPMPYECEAYMRNLFARGVRIWHGRRDSDGFYAPALFKTPYMNTAKEY